MLKFSIKVPCLAIVLVISTLCQASPFPNFITRKGDQLYDGQNVFRFIGVNTPNINGHYDGYKNTNPQSGYAYDPIMLDYEMENYFKDMSQMGVTVFRTWGITVANGSNEYEALVTGAGTYNEQAYRRMDKMLELCNRYNIRVILCLVKENSYWGGTAAFSALYGGGDYYSTPAVKNGFKDLLKNTVNRVNHFTGLPYKQDKAILAWEFGNEVPNKEVAWMDEMSTYMKSIDPVHLIIDSRRANGVEQLATLVDDVLNRCKNIDFVKTRQYPNYKGTVDELWAICKGKLPMIIDEYQRMDGFEEVLKRIQETGTTGGMLWSLMKYPYQGGLGAHVLFHSYGWGGSRWPGFDGGAYFNEEKNLQLIRSYSYKIRNMEIPSLPAPEDKPFLFDNTEKEVAALKWRCSPGARYYIVERASSKKGPWVNVSGDIDISFSLYFYPLFTDSSAAIGSTYFYRVKGKNASGTTAASNIIGPVKIKQRVIMDNLSDFSKVYSRSSNMTINTGTWPRLRQTEEDYGQAVRDTGTEAGEIIYKASQVKSVKVFVFNDKPDSLTIQYSADGVSWNSPSTPVQKTLRKGYNSMYSGQNNHPLDKYIYELNSLPAATKFIKIKTGNAGAQDSYPWIGRVHIGFTGVLDTEK